MQLLTFDPPFVPRRMGRNIRLPRLAAPGLLLALLSAPAWAEPLTLTDMAGREVRLPAPPERIVVLPLPAAPTLIAADRSARRLVGLHPKAHSVMLEGPLGRLFPDLARADDGILRSGASAFTPNVEALMVLEPDLVVQRGELGAGIVAPLEAAGLPTLLVRYGDEEAARSNIRLLGRVVGQEARAESFVAWREAVRTRLAGLGGTSSAPSVLFLSRSAGGYTTTGGGTPGDDAIRVAGGRNLAADLPGSTQIGIEQLLLWNPDVVILNSGDPNFTPATLAADPVLRDLSAVAAGRVYKAPTGGYRLEPPSPENPVYWLWLGALLHPDASGTSNLRAEMRGGFERLYGAEPEEAELDAMLQWDANRDASGYGELAGVR